MTTRSTAAVVFVTVLAVVAPGVAAAELRLAGPLGDGAVIQRGVAIPVSGTANPGARVVVQLGERPPRRRPTAEVASGSSSCRCRPGGRTS